MSLLSFLSPKSPYYIEESPQNTENYYKHSNCKNGVSFTLKSIVYLLGLLK